MPTNFAMFTDTHTHLTHPALFFRLPQIIAQARAVQVSQFIVPTAEHADWANALALLRQPEIRAIALGIHPWYAEQANASVLHELAQHLHQQPALLVGEIGLDFYDKTEPPERRAAQIQAFQAQLALAQQHRRPIILHNLRATAAIIQAIQSTQFTRGGIAHAFSGSLEEARLLMQRGFKIGIGSLLLNPRAKKARIAAQQLPLDALLLETDSPFGQPENQNTPANVLRVAQIVAELRGMTLDELAGACEQNLVELLGR